MASSALFEAFSFLTLLLRLVDRWLEAGEKMAHPLAGVSVEVWEV